MMTECVRVAISGCAHAKAVQRARSSFKKTFEKFPLNKLRLGEVDSLTAVTVPNMNKF